MKHFVCCPTVALGPDGPVSSQVAILLSGCTLPHHSHRHVIKFATYTYIPARTYNRCHFLLCAELLSTDTASCKHCVLPLDQCRAPTYCHSLLLPVCCSHCIPSQPPSSDVAASLFCACASAARLLTSSSSTCSERWLTGSGGLPACWPACTMAAVVLFWT